MLENISKSNLEEAGGLYKLVLEGSLSRGAHNQMQFVCLQVDGLITGRGGGLISASLQFYFELRSQWSVPAKFYAIATLICVEIYTKIVM